MHQRQQQQQQRQLQQQQQQQQQQQRQLQQQQQQQQRQQQQQQQQQQQRQQQQQQQRQQQQQQQQRQQQQQQQQQQQKTTTTTTALMIPANSFCCTAYCSPSEFWLQRRHGGGQELREILEAAGASASSRQLPAPAGRWQVGDKALAKIDDNWLRVEIIQAGTAPQEWQVRAVDFGWIEQVSSDEMRWSPEWLKVKCNLATRCRLAQVEEPDNGWTEEQKNLLESMLTSDDGNDLLLSAKFHWYLVTDTIADSVPVDVFRDDSHVNKNFEAPANRNQPATAVMAKFVATVSHVTSAGKVFVQKNQKQLSDLQDHLQFLEITDNLHRFSETQLPDKDEIFMVLQPESGYHYRGRLLEKRGSEARLLIIDFGYERVVSWSLCARIPARIRYEPQCQGFYAAEFGKFSQKFPDLSLQDCWDSVGSERVGEVQVSPKVSGNSEDQQQAEILVANTGQSLLEFLFTQAKPKAPTAYQIDGNLGWDTDNIVNATCTQVDAGDGIFYFQPTSADSHSSANDAQSQVHQLLSEVYQLDKLDRPAELRANLPVLVHLPEANQLVRATIQAGPHGNQGWAVELVDSGHRTVASAADIYSVPPELLSIPIAAVKCRFVSTQSTVTAGDECVLTIQGMTHGAYDVKLINQNVQRRIG